MEANGSLTTLPISLCFFADLIHLQMSDFKYKDLTPLYINLSYFWTFTRQLKKTLSFFHKGKHAGVLEIPVVLNIPGALQVNVMVALESLLQDIQVQSTFSLFHPLQNVVQILNQQCSPSQLQYHHCPTLRVILISWILLKTFDTLPCFLHLWFTCSHINIKDS